MGLTALLEHLVRNPLLEGYTLSYFGPHIML